MQLQSYYVQRHDNGAFLQNGKALVYLSGTSTLAALFDANGQSIGNPATADPNGLVSFAAPDNVYDLQFTSGDGSYSSPLFRKVQIFDLSGRIIVDGTTARIASPSDVGAYIRFTSGSPVAFTIPPDSAGPFGPSSIFEFEQAGAGVVTLTQGAGVTINSRGGLLGTAGQFAVASIKWVAPNTWTATGDL